jgi:glycosyltransferase involved in cell wall biosynthesis
MKIVFDARVLGDRMHGISRYCLNLLQRLLALDQDNEYLILTGLADVEDWFKPMGKVRWIRTDAALYSLKEQIVIPFLVRRERFDLFHSPTFTIPLTLASQGIITIHDLIPIIFPKDFGFRHRLFFRLVVRRVVSKCRKVFTVSEHSRQDIISKLQGHQERIVISPNGLDGFWEPKPKDPAFSLRHRLDQGYMLFVGNPKPHKNFNRVLSAFKLLVEDDHYSGNLVSVGLAPRNVPSELQDRVLFVPYCDDRDLGLFYSGADLLAAPSLYEGFGLPVLEAMACGCPVLISDQGALPEIAGEAGIPVNPYDIHDIKEGMKKILSDPDLRRILKDQGLKRSGYFSWEKTARIVLETYKSLEEKV